MLIFFLNMKKLFMYHRGLIFASEIIRVSKLMNSEVTSHNISDSTCILQTLLSHI